MATELIPTTLSEVGFGVYGKLYRGDWAFSYDAYLTNGLGDGIVLNETGRTHIPSGKREDQFAEDNNGSPAVSARLALHREGLGEVGLSYYGGIYNRYQTEGVAIDDKRRIDLMALDLQTEFYAVAVKGELALARIEVPASLGEFAGSRQWGGYVDLVVPLWRPPLHAFEQAVVNAALRLERVDFNVGTFAATGQKIYDEETAVVVGLSFRPVPGTVFRGNYRYHWIRDRLGKPAVWQAGIQFGLATYF